MRTIYLTLGFFILLGIGATCRTPPVAHADCGPGESGAECLPPTQAGDG